MEGQVVMATITEKRRLSIAELLELTNRQFGMAAVENLLYKTDVITPETFIREGFEALARAVLLEAGRQAWHERSPASVAANLAGLLELDPQR